MIQGCPDQFCRQVHQGNDPLVFHARGTDDPQHPHGLRLRFERDGQGVVTRFVPGDSYQGPPGIMHGGLVSTVADETAAWALIEKTGTFGFTTSSSVKFHRPVRIGVQTAAFGQVTKQSTRIVHTAVRVEQGGATCFTGDFSFILLDRTGAEKMLGAPLPEQWLRFAR